MTHDLEVWLFDARIGVLSLLDGRLSFSYDPEYRQSKDAQKISASLPLQAEPFTDHQTRPFFAGLLPEGELRRLIAKQFQISRQNDFGLLALIGGECAGAVSLRVPGNKTAIPSDEPKVTWLSDEEIIALLDELPHRPMLAGKEGLRLSLAGAQDKLPVIWDGARVGLPNQRIPSTHILKPAIRSLDNTVLNEGFCMTLAGIMDLSPARSEVRSLLGQSFLLVERYDRVRHAPTQTQRLHQEDFCQALAVVPELKYQNEGGPNLQQCFELVRYSTRPSAPEVLRLFDAVIFNSLIGNHDAHAKNFSLLYRNQSTVLAPFYDLLSTAVYPKLTSKMAMKIGGQYKFSEVEAKHWDQFADEAGLSKAQARKRILSFADSLVAAARALQQDPSGVFAEQAIVKKIVAMIDQRAALTRRRLAGPTQV